MVNVKKDIEELKKLPLQDLKLLLAIIHDAERKMRRRRGLKNDLCAMAMYLAKEGLDKFFVKAEYVNRYRDSFYLVFEVGDVRFKLFCEVDQDGILRLEKDNTALGKVLYDVQYDHGKRFDTIAFDNKQNMVMYTLRPMENVRCATYDELGIC